MHGRKKRPKETPRKLRPNTDPLTPDDNELKESHKLSDNKTIQSILRKTISSPTGSPQKSDKKVTIQSGLQEKLYDPFVEKTEEVKTEEVKTEEVKTEEVKTEEEEEEKLEKWRENIKIICKRWLGPGFRKAHAGDVAVLYSAIYEAEAVLYTAVFETASEQAQAQGTVNHGYESLMTYIRHYLLESVLLEASSYIVELKEIADIPEWEDIAADAICAINTILNLINQHKCSDSISYEIKDCVKAFDLWFDGLTTFTQYMSDIRRIVNQMKEGKESIGRVQAMDMTQLTSLGNWYSNIRVQFEKNKHKKKTIYEVHKKKLETYLSINDLMSYVKSQECRAFSRLVEELDTIRKVMAGAEEGLKVLDEKIRRSIGDCIEQLVKREPTKDGKDLLRQSYRLPLQSLKTLDELIKYNDTLTHHLQLPPPVKRNIWKWPKSIFGSVPALAPASPLSPLSENPSTPKKPGHGG